MSWLDDTENHRKRQIEQMVKAFGDDNAYFQKAKDSDTAGKSKKKDKTLADKSDMYKMRVLKLRKFNEQDQKEYVGVEDVANSYITNQENGDIVISKTEEGSPQGGPLSVNDTLIVDHGDADILDIQSTSFCPCLHI